MSIISSLSFIVMFINVSAGIYALRTDPSHRMNRLFFLQCLSLALWALTAVIIYPSHDKNQVILWYKISSFGFGLYYVFTLHLCLLFIRARLTPLRILSMYIPAIIIIAMTWFSYTLFEDFIFTGTKLKFIPAFFRPGFYVYLLYYISFVMITVTGMIRWQSRAESHKEKLQSRIIVPSYIATLITCTATDFVLPSFSFYRLPALAPVLLVINTGAILYAINKYNFLTPVKDIFDNSFILTYPAAAMLINKRRRIISVNNEFCENFACSKDDVAGMHINSWFSADQDFSERIGQLGSGEVKTCGGTIHYGSNRKIRFSAECSVLNDKFGDFTGILIILTDPAEGADTAGAVTGVIPGPELETDDERMIVDKEWGIDLAGRKMWYTPWPADESGSFRTPSADEIKTVYCVSGEAVNETLLYFEECGGETERLVSMLNEHMADKRFTTGRADLLDKSRWYSNEFYFYFIMFTKKVMGRYDFHFGENSDGQLSEHHKIYEKGFMEYIPYGKTVSGKTVHDVTTTNVLGLLIYFEKILKIDTSDLILFINSNIDLKYQVDRTFFNNETIWCGLEFIEYGFELAKILGNGDKNLIYASKYGPLNDLRIGKLIYIIPRFITISKLEAGILTTNNIHFRKIDLRPGYVKFIISFKKDFTIEKYSKYLKASTRNDSKIYLGALSSVIKIIYGLKSDPHSSLVIEDSKPNISFTIEYRWQTARYGVIFKTITGVIIAFLVSYTLFPQEHLFHSLFLSMAVFLIILTIEQKKNILEKLEDHLNASSQQLEVLEKTSAELLEERNTLEQKVIERTRELSLANEKLNELDRIKSDFFANISHEIRTPLTLMITPVEAVLSGGYNYRQDRAFFESIYNNGQRLLSLINNLLDFSRIDAGRMKMSGSRVNITAMAASHAEAIGSVCELRGLELRVNCAPEELLIWADREKMERILANLLSNAVKFTDSGSITMSVIQDDAEMCVLRIEDTGRGIPAERLESIFDRFTQVDSGPSRMFEGTGIGLAMVREYAKLHGGTVTVESRHIKDFPEDHGSIFTVKIPAGKEHFQSGNDVPFTAEENNAGRTYTLPYTELALTGIRQEALPVPLQTGSEPAEQAAYTILIVEDNPGMHTMLTGILSEQYRIINANNGLDALKILESGDDMPDLILSDVMMHGMDGYELTEKIRHIPGLDSIPVILLTAKAEPAMKLEGFSKGATDYIVKPFNMRELQSRIKAQLDLKSVRDRLERTNRTLYAELESRRMRNITVSESTEIKIRNVLDFINKNYSADISREGLAAAVELNPDHLSRMFNKVTGKRLDSYINELRINNAKSILTGTDKTVLEIAMESGFENLRTFNRLFRESEGMTPSEFRDKAGNRVNATS